MLFQDAGREDKARELRARQTRSEAILWAHLRDRAFDGLKFRRQRPLGPYFADFCCEEMKLIVEIDGGIHDTKHALEYDAERDEYMRQCGYTVLRVRADDVEQHIGEVRAIIRSAVDKIRFAKVTGKG